jgi:hypothetical protein
MGVGKFFSESRLAIGTLSALSQEVSTTEDLTNIFIVPVSEYNVGSSIARDSSKDNDTRFRIIAKERALGVNGV